MVGCFQTGTLAAQVVGREVVVGGQERRHDVLVLGGRDRARRVDEGTAGPQRGRSGGEDPGLQLGQRRGPSGLAPARVRARRERAEVGARRVDEHAVERVSCAVARRRRPCARRRCPRPYARRCGAARRRGRGGARRRRSAPSLPISAARCVVLPPGAAHRSSTRSPGCGSSDAARRPSRRATAASAGRRSHSGEAKTSNGASRISASPSGAGRDGQADGELVRRDLERVGADRRPRPARCRRPSARGRRRRRAPSNHSSAIHSRVRVGERRLRGRAVGQRVDERRAPRARRGAARR